MPISTLLAAPTSAEQRAAYMREHERKRRVLREATQDRNGRALGARVWGMMMRANRGVVEGGV